MIPEIHLIFDSIFDLILFTGNFIFNFHISTTPRLQRDTRSRDARSVSIHQRSQSTSGLVQLERGAELLLEAHDDVAPERHRGRANAARPAVAQQQPMFFLTFF